MVCRVELFKAKPISRGGGGGVYYCNLLPSPPGLHVIVPPDGPDIVHDDETVIAVLLRSV